MQPPHTHTIMNPPLLSPLLTDVVQAVPLGRAMLGITLQDPFNTPAVLFHVGFEAFFTWFYHFFQLCIYTVLYNLLKESKGTEVLPPKMRFKWNRMIELWEYGSGLDYKVE